MLYLLIKSIMKTSSIIVFFLFFSTCVWTLSFIFSFQGLNDHDKWNHIFTLSDTSSMQIFYSVSFLRLQHLLILETSYCHYSNKFAAGFRTSIVIGRFYLFTGIWKTKNISNHLQLLFIQGSFSSRGSEDLT